MTYYVKYDFNNWFGRLWIHNNGVGRRESDITNVLPVIVSSYVYTCEFNNRTKELRFNINGKNYLAFNAEYRDFINVLAGKKK